MHPQQILATAATEREHIQDDMKYSKSMNEDSTDLKLEAFGRLCILIEQASSEVA